MLATICIAGLYFSFVDLKSHRIPNRSLLILSVILLSIEIFTGQGIHFKSAAIALTVGTALSIFAGVGFGDVKLIFVLTLFVITPTQTGVELFLVGIAITSVVSLAVTLFRGGKSADPVALAPSIFMGAILCASFT